MLRMLMMRRRLNFDEDAADVIYTCVFEKKTELLLLMYSSKS